MIILNATTKSLEILLGSAVTTTELPFVLSAVDTGSTPPLVEVDGTTNGASAVTVLSAPTSTKVKIVKTLTVYNADTVPQIVTVRYNNNGTTRILVKVNLPIGYTLLYSGEVFNVYDSAGAQTVVDGFQVSAGKLLGRGSASGTGPHEPITVGSGLALTGTTLATVSTVDQGLVALIAEEFS